MIDTFYSEYHAPFFDSLMLDDTEPLIDYLTEDV